MTFVLFIAHQIRANVCRQQLHCVMYRTSKGRAIHRRLASISIELDACRHACATPRCGPAVTLMHFCAVHLMRCRCIGWLITRHPTDEHRKRPASNGLHDVLRIVLPEQLAVVPHQLFPCFYPPRRVEVNVLVALFLDLDDTTVDVCAVVAAAVHIARIW